MRREFGQFVMLGETDDEVVGILNELCATLEAMDTKPEDARANRPSIVDPNVIAMKGRLATNTSSKVDMTSKQPGTKTVNDYQITALGRERKPKTSRRHVCPICCREGHHAKTCRDVLLDEHAERADGFFKRLIESNATEQYARAMSARVSAEFATAIAARIRAVSASMRGVSPTPSGGSA